MKTQSTQSPNFKATIISGLQKNSVQYKQVKKMLNSEFLLWGKNQQGQDVLCISTKYGSTQESLANIRLRTVLIDEKIENTQALNAIEMIKRFAESINKEVPPEKLANFEKHVADEPRTLIQINAKVKA